jgi:hypothetical protein
LCLDLRLVLDEVPEQFGSGSAQNLGAVRMVRGDPSRDLGIPGHIHDQIGLVGGEQLGDANRDGDAELLGASQSGSSGITVRNATDRDAGGACE